MADKTINQLTQATALTDSSLFVIEQNSTAKQANWGMMKNYISPGVAAQYSTSATYNVGDYVIYNGSLYRCNTAITTGEAWTAAHWTAAVLGNDVEALKRDLHYVTEDAEDTDWVSYLGVTQGQLQSNGTTNNASNIVTTGFIPVEYGKMYVCEHPNQTSNYTTWRCTYDENKNLIQYVSYSLTSPLRPYVVGAGVAYVRWSVSVTVYNQGFRFRLQDNRFYTIESELSRVGNSIDYLDEKAKTVDYVALLGVTFGLLQSNGTVNDNGNYTTTDFIPLEEGGHYVIERPGQTTNYSVWRCTYDENKNLISYVGNYQFESPIRGYDVPLGVKYVRFSVSNTVYNGGFRFRRKYNSFEELEFKCSPDFSIFTYNGTKPNLDIEKSYYCMPFFMDADPTIPSGHTAQGFAIYSNFLFQFMADDLVRLYDINDMGALIGDVATKCGHGNSAVFSDTFYDSSDEFPLVYVSDIDGNVYVNRITRTSSELIRTLYFNPATFAYTPQLALDKASNICYVVGKIANDVYVTDGLKITKCDLSNLTDNGDGTYTPAIIETYNITPGSIYQVLQGVKYLNGCLYLCSGSGSQSVHSDICIVDTTTKTVINHINNFPAIPTVEELEDIEFYPNPETARYDVIMHIRTYGYYKLIFN